MLNYAAVWTVVFPEDVNDGDASFHEDIDYRYFR